MLKVEESWHVQNYKKSLFENLSFINNFTAKLGQRQVDYWNLIQTDWVALATPTPVAAGAKLHSGARAATRADKRSICCGELLFSDDCADVTAIGPVSLGGAVVVSSFCRLYMATPIEVVVSDWSDGRTINSMEKASLAPTILARTWFRE